MLGGDPGTMWSRSGFYQWVKALALDAGLAGRAFPYDYGVLIIIGGVISAAGVIAYMFVEEPPAEHVGQADARS